MGAYLPLPYVYEREGRQERAWDIYSRLLRDRIVFIGTPIDDYVANSIIAQLLFLQMEDPKKDVHLYINSPGGECFRRDGDLRHTQFYAVRCGYLLHWNGSQHEYRSSCCRNPWQKVCPSQQPGNDPSTEWWGRWADL